MIYIDKNKNTRHAVQAFTRVGNIFTIDIIDPQHPSGCRRVICGAASIEQSE